MPKGSLLIQVTGLSGIPLHDRVDVEFGRFAGDLGGGGEPMQVSFKPEGATDVTISGILCRGGQGTMYRVLASTPHHRVYSFFQVIQEDTVNTASDDIEFWVKPDE